VKPKNVSVQPACRLAGAMRPATGMQQELVKKIALFPVVGIGSTPKVANTAMMLTSVFLPFVWVEPLPIL